MGKLNASLAMIQRVDLLETYSKICKVQVDVKRVEGLSVLACNLPCLRSSFSDTPIHGFANIVEHLRCNVTDTDSRLERDQMADLKVFSDLVVGGLLPSLKHTFWLNSSNYVDVSRPAWSSLTTFPFSLHVPIHARNRVLSSFKDSFKFKKLSDEALAKQVLNTGIEAINLLSHKLANHTFFFGEKATSIDALLFACLTPLLHIKHPCHLLQTHLQGCPNLLAYCQRILEEFFPEHAAKLAEARRMEEEKAKEEARRAMQFGEFPNKRRDLLIGLALAGASMLLYGLLSGKLVKVVVEEGRDVRVLRG